MPAVAPGARDERPFSPLSLSLRGTAPLSLTTSPAATRQGYGGNRYQLHPKWAGGRRLLADDAQAPIFRLLARLVGWGRGGGGARADDAAGAAGAPLDAAAAA